MSLSILLLALIMEWISVLSEIALQAHCSYCMRSAYMIRSRALDLREAILASLLSVTKTNSVGSTLLRISELETGPSLPLSFKLQIDDASVEDNRSCATNRRCRNQPCLRPDSECGTPFQNLIEGLVTEYGKTN